MYSFMGRTQQHKRCVTRHKQSAHFCSLHASNGKLYIPTATRCELSVHCLLAGSSGDSMDLWWVLLLPPHLQQTDSLHCSGSSSRA
jgi:hypothetical protein